MTFSVWAIAVGFAVLLLAIVGAIVGLEKALRQVAADLIPIVIGLAQSTRASAEIAAKTAEVNQEMAKVVLRTEQEAVARVYGQPTATTGRDGR